MSISLEASLVRIFATDGGVVGTGFLVGETTVLTCAHVVATALGITADVPKAPERAVSLDFPLVASGCRLSAQVILWQSIQADGGGDIALLHLEQAPPDEAKVARLVIADDLWDHPFRAFGFPDNHDQGIWASGKLRAHEATGWIQIEDVKTTGKGIQRGFSGGAIWDEQLEGVAGMVVAADEDASKVAYMIPAQVLIQVVPTLRQQAIPPCPYRGLFAFREQDAAYFFGREYFTQQLIDAIRTKSLAAVVGPSGSGKSSVVFAGLIPCLHHEGNWLIVSCRPGTHPFRSIAAPLIPLLEPKMSETDRLVEIKKLAERLEQGTVDLHDIADRLQQLYSVAHLLVVVDQFEELYTAYQKGEEPQYFLETLLAAVAPNSRRALCDFHILLTLRADFFGHVLSYRPFADVLQNADVKLGPMTRQELQEAIKKPAQKLHVQVEDGLTERLLDGVGSAPGSLPLLEFALSLLWTRQLAGTLTHAAYDEIGGVEQALALYAEEVYERLEEEEQRQVLHIFMQLVQPGEGTEDVRRLATRAEIGEERWDVVIRLSDARLVVTGRNEATGQETVEIVHETLIREWKRLRSWIEANREFRLWQERLRGIIRQWDSSDREKDLLLRGTPLGEAERWLLQYTEALSEEEKAFIDHSKAEKHQREAAEWDRQAKETRELAAKRQVVKRLRFAVIALSISLITVVVLTSMVGILLGQTNDALRVANLQKQIARSQALAAQADFYLSKNQVSLAMLLSIKAYQTDNNFESRDSLLSALEYSPKIATVLRGGDFALEPFAYRQLTSLAFSPDGQTLISADDLWPGYYTSDGVADGTFSPASQLVGRVSSTSGLPYSGMTLWNMATKQPHNLLLAPIKYPSYGVYSVAFSPKEQTFASAGDEGAWLWDARTGVPIAPFSQSTDIAGVYASLTFSPNGAILAEGGCNGASTGSGYCTKGQINLWNVATKARISTSIVGQMDHINRIAFSPDGKLLAAGGCITRKGDNDPCVGGQVLLWKVTAGKLVGPIGPPIAGGHHMANDIQFSPDGNILAIGNDDGTITLWNVASRTLLGSPLSGHVGRVLSIAFNPNGSILASGGVDKTVRLWDVAQRIPIGNPLIGHQSGVTSVAWSSNGQLVSGDAFDAIILWNISSISPISQVLRDASDIHSTAFSPDGKLVATGDADGKIVLRVRHGAKITDVGAVLLPTNLATPQEVKKGDLEIDSLAFSSDGRILAARMRNGTIILWDVGARSIIAKLTNVIRYVSNIALSPDGHTLAVVGEGGVVILWDVVARKAVRRLANYNDKSNETTHIAFSPDGRILVTSGQYRLTPQHFTNEVIFWDVATGKPIGEPITDQKYSPVDVSFNPDGHIVAMLSEDGFITQWDTVTQKLISRFSVNDGESIYYFHVAFSSNGKMLAVVGANDYGPNATYTTNVWDMTTLKPIAHPFHYNYVYNLMFSPDGQQLASVGDFDTTNRSGLIISNVNPESWQASACSIVNRNFTVDEWNKFANGEPYYKVCPQLPVHETVIRQMLIQAQFAAEKGDKNAASVDYRQATQWVAETKNAILANYICWYGSIDQFAKEVLPACEQAVELEPNNGVYRDSRGLEHALTENRHGAIEDFQFFLTWAAKNNLYPGKPYLSERKAWINELEAGRNPFDAKTLKALLQE